MWQGTKFEENMITCILARLWHLSVVATDYIAFSLPEASQDPAFHFLVQDFHKNPDETCVVQECKNLQSLDMSNNNIDEEEALEVHSHISSRHLLQTPNS
jgi:hypothetical protein